MHEHAWLAERFEEQRAHLRAVAYRMLGSLNDADDAVQETWLRLSRSESETVENLGGWLTTVVGRICLDMLRTRRTRREEPLPPAESGLRATPEVGSDPEYEALLADSVGLALLVVLDTLSPAERLAFVLHDIFGMPLSELAPLIGRSPPATRQLASRARRRVRGRPMAPATDLARQREVVDAFLAAARSGDFDALLALLDPEVVLQADSVLVPKGSSAKVQGASAVARQFMGSAVAARSALVDGVVGVVVAPHGRLRIVLRITIVQGKIRNIEAVADPARLGMFNLAAFDSWS